MEKILYCLVGASGSGKTTLASKMKDLGIPELISHTTRKPRKGEVNGVNYYFVTKEEFDKVETAEYTVVFGDKYGVSTKELNDKFNISKSLVVVVNLDGVKQLQNNLKNKGISVKTVYIKADLPIIEERMSERGDSIISINERLASAPEEFKTEYYADFIVDNRGSLEDSISQLKKIMKL